MSFPSENPSSFLRLGALYMYKGEKKKEDLAFYLSACRFDGLLDSCKIYLTMTRNAIRSAAEAE